MAEEPWRDEATLRELYSEKKLASTEIADRFGCSATTVLDWLDRHGIEKRTASEAKVAENLSEPANFELEMYGYEQWRTTHRGRTDRVRVHRLAAVAKFGFDAVCDKVVHHESGVEWDNRLSNLSLMEWGEHTRHHIVSEQDEAPWRDEDRLREAYKSATRQELADRWGCGRATIDVWVERFGLSKDRFADGPWRDKETLGEIIQYAGPSEIAEWWGCSSTTIHNWLDRHDLR